MPCLHARVHPGGVVGDVEEDGGRAVVNVVHKRHGVVGGPNKDGDAGGHEDLAEPPRRGGVACNMALRHSQWFYPCLQDITSEIKQIVCTDC